MLVADTSKKQGFDTVVKAESFKCAFITHSPMYSFGKVSEMKRHNKTDEVFVLLSGSAVMLIYENGKFTEYKLSQKVAYNVKAQTWHYLGVSEDAMLFVTENADTDATNSDVITLENTYLLKGM